MGDINSPSPTGQPVAPVQLPTLKQEWLLISVVLLLMMVCIGIDVWHFPSKVTKGDRTPLIVVAGILHMLGSGLWITMDRKRRGLEVGRWRFAAVFLGPITILFYLALEYKGKALLLLPVMVGLYIAMGFVPTFVVIILRHVMG